MQEQEIELAVGEVVQIGRYTVTVIDIDGTEVSFRIDLPESDERELDELVIENSQPAMRHGK